MQNIQYHPWLQKDKKTCISNVVYRQALTNTSCTVGDKLIDGQRQIIISDLEGYHSSAVQL